MLAVSAGLAPDDGAGGIIDGMAVAVGALAVGFHVSLLKIGGKTMQILIVGKDGLGLSAEEIVVPDAHDAEDRGEILFQRGRAEMFVHGVSAGEQLLEIIHADEDGDGQAYGG